MSDEDNCRTFVSINNRERIEMNTLNEVKVQGLLSILG